jgi:hypothetical protein
VLAVFGSRIVDGTDFTTRVCHVALRTFFNKKINRSERLISTIRCGLVNVVTLSCRELML